MELCELEEFLEKKGERYREHIKIVAATNRENCSMLIDALNKKFSSITTIEDHLASTGNRALSFHGAEKLLNFAGLLERCECTSQFGELGVRVINCIDKASKVLPQYKESIERSVEEFIDCFMDSKGDKPKELYDAAYKGLQKKLKVLTDIENLPKVSRLMLPDDHG